LARQKHKMNVALVRSVGREKIRHFACQVILLLNSICLVYVGGVRIVCVYTTMVEFEKVVVCWRREQKRTTDQRSELMRTVRY
jgi:hypothetical protein